MKKPAPPGCPLCRQAWQDGREMLGLTMFNLIKWPAFGENACFRLAVAPRLTSGAQPSARRITTGIYFATDSEIE
ncbi:hypothetical protein [Janthinobacterium psychrotolerans]|uniref:hypothetical protein n=1 Tax=Janthinobacterium psychrotolerans TaxID=1747903 RepID=UPI0012378A28|nr:hypothetical protein [Janthinobacterium psychrotolerans]